MWNLDAGQTKESFSLEKCFYLFLKLLDLVGKLEALDVFAYTEMTMDTLYLEATSLKLYLNTEMTSSFKLYPIGSEGFLQIPLFNKLDELYF